MKEAKHIQKLILKMDSKDTKSSILKKVEGLLSRSKTILSDEGGLVHKNFMRTTAMQGLSVITGSYVFRTITRYARGSCPFGNRA